MTTITKAIVLRAQQGDEGAERTIVDELQRPVIATIYRCLGPARGADVEAIAQELFLDLFRNIGRFDARRMKFTTWVYELVRDRCADVLASQPRAPSGAAATRDHSDVGALQKSQAGEATELDRRIAEVLSTLSEEQRMAFVLHEYERLEHSEIATITGVNETTVKSRLARAKESLRVQLQPYLNAEA